MHKSNNMKNEKLQEIINNCGKKSNKELANILLTLKMVLENKSIHHLVLVGI